MKRLGRTGRRAAAGAAALFLSATLAGCASMFGGSELAPNGLTRTEADLRRGLARDPGETYEEVVEGTLELPDDDLLRLLYAGTAGRYAGSYHESSQYLDVAGYLADDRVTTSVSRQALSFITSDRALAYTTGRTERLMIPYVSALSFLETGDLGGAVVEARRIEALLDRFDDGVAREETPEASRFLHYFAATIFDAAGETNAADVAYRRAGSAGPEVRVPEEYEAVPEDSLGEVVVLVERGFVPHRVEQSVVIALPPFQVKQLTEGSAAEKAAAAAAAASRILLYAATVYGDRGPFYTDQRYRRPVHVSPWRDCDRRPRPSYCDPDVDDFDPYVLRISWPVLYQDPVPDRRVEIRTEDATVAASWHLDVGAGVRRDFGEARASMLARTVFRAATKMALSATAEDAVSERDEAAGRIVGLLINLGTLLTERADTRSWHLLPGTVEMVRMKLPSGSHDLAIEGGGWLARDIDLGSVEVRPGRTTFVTHRVWR